MNPVLHEQGLEGDLNYHLHLQATQQSGPQGVIWVMTVHIPERYHKMSNCNILESSDDEEMQHRQFLGEHTFLKSNNHLKRNEKRNCPVIFISCFSRILAKC